MPEIIAKAISEMPKTAVYAALRLRGNSNTLALIRRIVEACVCHLKLTKTAVNDIELAATEACTNIIKHAYRFDGEKFFKLELSASEEVFLIQASYADPGFVPEAIPEPNLKEIKEGGLGVYIIRNIMDHVVYQTDSSNGTVKLSMLKFLEKKTKVEG